MLTAEEVVRLLAAQGKTLTTAESCTGGRIAKELTDVSGASEVFFGGLVTYSNRLKQKWLGVRAETLSRFGAVSEQTAREMAVGARLAAETDFAVAVTGIAGPHSDGTDKPVGLIYIALAGAAGVQVQKLQTHFTQNVREQNRRAATEYALEWIRRELQDAEG